MFVYVYIFLYIQFISHTILMIVRVAKGAEMNDKAMWEKASVTHRGKQWKDMNTGKKKERKKEKRQQKHQEWSG